jgi:Tfp pilus assembly protein PilN
MHDLDFLPIEFHQTHAQKRWQPWRAIVMTAVAVLLAGGVASQHLRRRHLESQLAGILPAHQTALRQQSRLSGLQTGLQRIKADAELVAYLHHPWPRTRILEALLDPLPRQVTLEHLEIHREAAASKNPGRFPQLPAASQDKQSEAKAKEALPPAAGDLKQLRDTCDPQQTMVAISGVATDSDALHEYLGRLAHSRLVAKAELVSIEREPESGMPPAAGQPASVETVRFHATLTVKPGYGQPGGPGKGYGSDPPLPPGEGRGERTLGKPSARRFSPPLNHRDGPDEGKQRLTQKTEEHSSPIPLTLTLSRRERGPTLGSDVPP